MGFDLYAHMLINNIGGLDDVSESRCCKHNLMKCPEDFEAPEIENELEKWQAERDALYLCGLTHWKEVKETYDALEEKCLKNRALEIDKATLSIAKIVGCYALVLNYIIENNARRKMQDLESDWGYHALLWWKEHALEQWKSSADCAEEIASTCLESESTSPYYKKELHKLKWHLGKILGRYPIIKARMHRGTKQYFMSAEIWRQIVKARGYENAFDLTDFMPTTNTINTIPTIPTINTTVSEEGQKTLNGAQFSLESGGHGGHGGHGGQEGDKTEVLKPSTPDLPWLPKKSPPKTESGAVVDG
jgi:hypothetical protein